MKKDLNKANVEGIQSSIIDSDVRFSSIITPHQEILLFRRQHIDSTQMCWITLQPVIDFANNVYNPKALIMIILN